jgi:hypothetical protein
MMAHQACHSTKMVAFRKDAGRAVRASCAGTTGAPSPVNKDLPMKSDPIRIPDGRCAAAGTGLTLFLAVCLLAGCETPQERVEHHEDNLAAAGFIVRPANTPAREDMLKRLPANKFVQRAQGDTVTYIYADPMVCNCLYVGTQQGYNQYQLHQQQQNLAAEQQLTAQTYADSAWNWGSWGPRPGLYGFGYNGAIGG